MVKKKKLSFEELEKNQKKKAGQYLKTASIITTGLIVVLLVLFYGRINISPSTPVVSDEASKTVQGRQSGEELRTQFKEKMRFYENEVKPRIKPLKLSNWAEKEQIELEGGEYAAIEDFANGNFSSAVDKLDGLIAKVSELQGIHEEFFLTAMEKTQKAFESGHFEQALSALNQALLYKPDDVSVLQLKNRIAVMQEVDALVEAADTAHAENRLNKEIALLDQVIGLDPARTHLVERHRLLLTQRNERNFDVFLEKGWAALEEKDIASAKANLDQATRLFPDREELAFLSGKIKQSEMEFFYQSTIKRAQAAESDDDWASAEAHYAKVLRVSPDDARSKTGFDRAHFINQQIQRLEKSLLRPERLSDPDIADAARKLIEKNGEEATRSLKLRQLASRLNEAIRIASVPVPVTVYSDGKTQISVLGVGIIGKVLEYRLKQGLKSGNYTFKGERKGFKDKLVKVQVRHGKAVKVTVICDESI